MEKKRYLDKKEEKHRMGEIELDSEVYRAFCLVCKRGIYKELKRKNFITDAQLNLLLEQLE